MPREPGSGPTFLQDATPEQLEAAVAWNHHEWMVQGARQAGGEVRQADGVTWTYAASTGEGVILFPRIAEERSGDRLDAIVAYYRERRPDGLVGCWSLDPTQPADLDTRLLARGFQPGWRPRWMWLDLERMREEPPQPNGLEVKLANDAADWDVEDLPYYDRREEAARRAAAGEVFVREWRFGARLDGRVVGHSTLSVTTGPLGVAGLYSIGVVPAARNRGIGKAVTLAACRQARAMGCRYALLNGTGEPMYRQIGFERLGYGRTWWLNVPRLEANPPTAGRVALAEAVGRGDIQALDSLGARSPAPDLDTPLANEMTLLQLAVEGSQPLSAEWLVAHGATLDIVSAWDLGWRDRVPALLSERPDLANRRAGPLQGTPLHDAAHRNDVELARVLLAANPDLETRDGRFQATALDWARHSQAAEVVDLLERHEAGGREA